MAFCSAVTLCFASIFSLMSAALLAIAFATDNWQMINVQRENLTPESLVTDSVPDSNAAQRLLDAGPIYYTRTRGLFRECFLGQKEPGKNQPIPKPDGVVDLYMSPVETWCHNINYYIPDEGRETQKFTSDKMTLIHMGRSMIALFITAFFCMVLSFFTGVVGCWKTAPSHITTSAVLMLFACLLSAGAMGLWHGVEHFEKMKITEVDPEGIEFFVRGWPKILIDNTSFRYDWSYIVAWIGVGMCLGSAILFSLAALCIKSDKEREEAMNMQYLMPVYPQKGQPYGPYGYPAYPGPYYGSQYGLPYSQY